jgi:hypothetical protein
MKRLLLILAALAAVSAAANETRSPGATKRPIVRPEWNVAHLIVEVEYISRDERPYTEMSKPNEDGWVRCVIHTWKPKRVDDAPMETLGHEVAHCLFGRYHFEN